MDIKFLNDEESLAKQAELLKLAGKRGRGAETMEAQEALAALVEPIIPQVIAQAATSSLIYQARNYDFDTVPSIPLDTFEGNEEGLLDIWSSTIAGGLPTNHVSGADEFRLGTTTLETAVSMLKRYLREARLDVLQNTIKKVAQEMLAKTEYLAWQPIMTALANASTNSLQHLVDATVANVFQVQDVNNMIIRSKRLNTSWLNGTPAVPTRGITDLILSPEIMGQVRGFAYNPMNTRAVPDTNESTALGLPDKVREEIYRAGGAPSIYGLGLIEINELGDNQSLTKLFDAYYTAGGGEVGFDSATDDLVIGVDVGRDAFIKMNARNDSGNTFSLEVDDQFVARQDKAGWYGSWEGGFAVIDNKGLMGLVV